MKANNPDANTLIDFIEMIESKNELTKHPERIPLGADQFDIEVSLDMDVQGDPDPFVEELDFGGE